MNEKLKNALNKMNEELKSFYDKQLPTMEKEIDIALDDSANAKYEDELEVIGAELANIRHSIQEIQRCVQMANQLKR